MKHCIEKIVALVEHGRDDRRSILQIGYNLGRLSELTGLGREPFWDRWKGAVEAWNLAELQLLARDLLLLLPSPSITEEPAPGSSPPAPKGE